MVAEIARRWFAQIFVVTLLISANMLSSQDSDSESMDEIWQATRTFLFNREYGIAISFLESCADDPDFVDIASQIQSDIQDVSRLQRLAGTVAKVIESLKPGDTFKDGSSDLVFERIDKNVKGDVIVVKDSSGRQRKTTMQKLHSNTWLELANRSTDSAGLDDFTVGIFLAFDRVPDVKASRTKLNSTELLVEKVPVWIARINQLEVKNQKGNIPANTNKKGLLGKWQMLSPSRRPIGAPVIFHKNGTTDAERIRKWTRETEGVYRLTLADGKTATVFVTGDKMRGKSGRGKFYGTRLTDE